MDMKVIPLSQLKKDPQGVLSDCCDQDCSVVVELPDHRLVSIQPLEADDTEDSLVNDLLKNNPAFRALVKRSKASPRKPFASKS